MSDEKLLEVVDLQAGYNGMAVVHDVSFSVREGEILAILGSNGSGKTTTLRAITGTIKPMSGIIRLPSASPSCLSWASSALNPSPAAS